jgi:hypothetical protein
MSTIYSRITLFQTPRSLFLTQLEVKMWSIPDVVYLRNKSWKPECVGVLTWIGGY